MLTSAYVPVDPTGGAHLSWPIPNQLYLQGYQANLQWAVFEGPGKFPPITLTHGYACTIGFTPPVVFETIGNNTGGTTGAKAQQGNVGVAARLVLN